MSENSNVLIKKIFNQTKTIAILGLSGRETQPSHIVAKYLKEVGFQIIPVNPALDEVLGETCYASLKDIPIAVDVVNCFRAPQHIPAIVDEAIRIGAKTIWMQLGIEEPDAAEKARSRGLDVIQNLCIKIEHQHNTMTTLKN